MNTWLAEPDLLYPESDGKPLAENTLQLRWITTLYGNIAALFADRADVFVAGDLLWYPVEGHPEINVAPDVMVVFGRPKGDRRSYRQWKEEDIGPQVVFEIRSHTNTDEEMTEKELFYTDHGVEELYDYDPQTNRLKVFVRKGGMLWPVRKVNGYVSPLTGVQFLLTDNDLIVVGSDRRPFLTFEELRRESNEAAESLVESERQRIESERQRVESERQRIESERQRIESERQRIESERLLGERELQLTESERQRAAAERRTARLVELGREARCGQATADELVELDSLESDPS